MFDYDSRNEDLKAEKEIMTTELRELITDDTSGGIKKTLEKAGDVMDIEISEDNEANEIVVEFSGKYRLDGEIIERIDLDGLKNVTAKQAQKIEKLYRKITKNLSASPELTLDYAIAAASFVTGLPIEFFEQLKLSDMTKIKTRVINFIYAD